MPKMTIVTLPAAMVMTQEQIIEKNKKTHGISLRTIFYKMSIFITWLISGEKGFLGILAFLLGRVFIMGEFAPIGLAFFAAVVQADIKRGILVGFWATVGVLSGGYYYEAGIYLFSMGLYFLVGEKMIYRYKKNIVTPVIMFGGVLCAGLVVSFFKGGTLYTTLVVLFEAATCVVLSYIFMYTIPLFINRQNFFSREEFTSERLSCMVILLATAVAGLGNTMVFDYSIRNMVGSVLIMTMALLGGTEFSVVMGVVIGLVVGLSDGNASLVITFYALAGVLAGVFRGLGKVGVIVGFMLGTAITVLYFGQDNELNKTMSECAISGVAFLLIPSGRLLIFQKGSSLIDVERVRASSQLNQAMAKINAIASIFDELAVKFGKVTIATREKIHDDELAKTLSAIGEQVCATCSKRSQCWEMDFYRTYHGILELLSQVELKAVGIKEMPMVFQENCIRHRDLLDVIKDVSERNRTLAFWQKKILDNRQMVTQQMKAAGGIMNALTDEVAKVDYVDLELARILQEKLSTIGCSIEGIEVKGEGGEEVITVWKEPCNDNRECKNTILPLVANVIKEKMVLRGECGNKAAKKKCKLMMQVAKRFTIETGVASIPKKGQEVCGDTCAVVELNQGKVALVLSDGMGSGASAEEQSKTTIDFLCKLLTAGFTTDVAVKTINSMLLLRSPEESFATIDIGIIDTYSGEVEFLKVGSAPSFVKRVREVATIRSTALPIGILEDIEIQPVKATIVVGDFIVMVSDGIIDVPRSKLDKGIWLANFLRQSVNQNPQVLADHILAQAQKLSGNTVVDDMTVLVARVIE